MTKTAFLFPGQGAQSVGMGAALAATEASARAWHEEREAAIPVAERLAADLVIERAETAALKARPDRDEVVELLSSQ